MPSSLAHRIVQAIRSVIGTDPAGLHEPRFQGNERAYLMECLDSTYVSSVGAFVDRFEAGLAAYTGATHAVATVNGTAALHTALLLAGVQAGDEVLVPALTFVATANAVSYCGAWPHFVDSEARTLGIDPSALREYLQRVVVRQDSLSINRETGRVLRALVPVHALGHPVNMVELLAVAEEYNLVLVEDAAESLGSTWLGRHTGTFGRMGILSFNGNKIITTGGGGCILTDDTALAHRARHLTTTAKLPHRWAFEHDRIAYNYRMPNLNAALGCAQLESLPDLLASKRRLHSAYAQAFATVSGVSLLTEPDGANSNYWLPALILDETMADERDAILTATHEAGLMTRPLWTLMPHLSQFAHCPKADLPVAESLVRRVINIPGSAFLI